ncbi:protein atonal homolog 8 [Polypterus senegalus]|uniref:protein atonal homolog 8 n=1 Tax=Polypterus senegalus TaxID=55291 RepID=UPI0019641431|nr:protein atonal homolog 8 [Polypterus senegalus]
MRNPQTALEGGWKNFCETEIGSIKRLKRKSKDALRSPNGVKTFKEDADFQARLLSVVTERTARTLNDDGTLDTIAAPDSTMDIRRRTLHVRSATLQSVSTSLTSPSAPADKPGRSAQVVCFGEQQQSVISESNLRSRIGLCSRPPEDAFMSPPQASYISSGSSSLGDSAASPRKRLGENVGEIKAVQQTRRLLANARERTRVHTISAAFEALRKQVPCYSYGQKLSKLAILRIACNYILSLAQLADLDYTSDHSNLSFSECVDQCTRTLQAEGRSKKRKE